MRRAELRGARVQRTAARIALEGIRAQAADSTADALRRDPIAFCAGHTVDVPWAWWGQKGRSVSDRSSKAAWIVGVVGEMGGNLEELTFEVQPRPDGSDPWDRTDPIELGWADLMGHRTYGERDAQCVLQQYEGGQDEGVGAAERAEQARIARA